MSWNFIEHFNLLGHIVVGIILPFLFVLTIIVFVHELGHFLVARWCGIKVLVFSIGFGPEIVGFNDRHGTRWKISAIPPVARCEMTSYLPKRADIPTGSSLGSLGFSSKR